MTIEMAENLPEREEAVEILPPNMGELTSSEAVPLLRRAAARLDILRPKTPFWKGMRQNLEGASAWIEAQTSKLASKTLRSIVGASLITTVVACARISETLSSPKETASKVVFLTESPPPPDIRTREELNKAIGICGFSGDFTGARAWFELVEKEDSPPLGTIRVISGSEGFGYDLVEQAVGNQITGKYYVPEIDECKEIGFREGKVWLFRGLTPKGRFVSTPVP